MAFCPVEMPRPVRYTFVTHKLQTSLLDGLLDPLGDGPLYDTPPERPTCLSRSTPRASKLRQRLP